MFSPLKRAISDRKAFLRLADSWIETDKWVQSGLYRVEESYMIRWFSSFAKKLTGELVMKIYVIYLKFYGKK